VSGLEKFFPGSNNKTVNASVACHFIEAQIFVTDCCLFAVSGQVCENRLIIICVG
jgi:hypothetical protein